jgi:hypothetical protein
MRAKLTFPLSVAFTAAFAAQIEGMLVTRWASDRGSACSASSPVGACSLAATLTALVLFRNGKRFSAAVTATALVLALVVEHAWLLTYAR